jgi:hypothetical protein
MTYPGSSTTMPDPMTRPRPSETSVRPLESRGWYPLTTTWTTLRETRCTSDSIAPLASRRESGALGAAAWAANTRGDDVPSMASVNSAADARIRLTRRACLKPVPLMVYLRVSAAGSPRALFCRRQVC